MHGMKRIVWGPINGDATCQESRAKGYEQGVVRTSLQKRSSIRQSNELEGYYLTVRCESCLRYELQ